MLPESDVKAFHSLVALCGFSLLFSISILFCLIIFTNIFSGLFNKKIWIYYIPLSVFLFSCYQGLRFWLMRKKKFAIISICLISSVIMGSVVSIVIGYFSKQENTYLSGLLIGYIFEGILKPCIMLVGSDIFNINYLYKLSFNKCLYSIIRYKKLIFTLLISHGISALYSRALIMAIEMKYGSTVLGYFSMAQKIISAPPALIANALGDVFRQRASVLWRESNDFSGLFKKTLFLSAFIGIPIYAIGIIVAPDVFAKVLGEQWRTSGEYASILMISGVFAFIATPVDKGAIIVGATKYIFKWHLLRLLTYMLAILFTIYSDSEVFYLLYVIVVIDVFMWVLDAVFEYRFSKGIVN